MQELGNILQPLGKEADFFEVESCILVRIFLLCLGPGLADICHFNDRTFYLRCQREGGGGGGF